MTHLNIYLLGSPRILWHDAHLDIRSRRAIALLAYLSMQPENQAVNRNFLADFLWSGNNNNRSRLRRTIYDLKDMGADDWLVVTRTTVMLNPDVSLYVDVRLFKDQFTDDITLAPYENLKEAVHVYKDVFLQGFSLEEAPNFSAWMQSERQSLHAQYLSALEQLAHQARDAGETQEAVHYVQQLLQHDPLREAMHRMLMRLYVKMKQREAAMQQYHDLTHLLRDELGESPQPATRQLYDDLLQLETNPEDTDPLISRRNRPTNLFPPAPSVLIGRDKDRNKLYSALLSEDIPSIGIFGLPGVGKSALIASIVNSQGVQIIFSGGILWVSLGANPDIEAKLNALCTVLGIIPADTIENTSMKLQGALKAKKTLIIIDDIYNEADANPFKLIHPMTKIVFMTRSQPLARSLIGTEGDSYHLSPLSEEDSLARITQFCPEAVETYHDPIKEILGRINGIPLAINAFGQMLKTEWEFGLIDDFFAQMADMNHLLSATLPADVVHSSAEEGYTLKKQFLANIPQESHTRFRQLLAIIG